MRNRTSQFGYRGNLFRRPALAKPARLATETRNAISVHSYAIRNDPSDLSLPRARGVTSGFSAWGALPLCVLVGAVGLLLVAQSMRMAVTSTPAAEPIFWAGLLLIYAPPVYRLTRLEVARGERIALVAWIGIALYFVKVLREPSGFTFHDEFPHWRTAFDIARFGRLFHVNSLQEISASFPGLEIVTVALTQLSGLSLVAAGTIVIGISRVIHMLALYFLYEEASNSARLAAIGVALAVVYPNFVFWSAQFSYESLALPLAILTLLLISWQSRRRSARGPAGIAALLAIVAITVTHHLTSYWLAAMLVAVYGLARLQPRLMRVLGGVVDRLPTRARQLLRVDATEPERAVAPALWGPFAALAVIAAVAWATLAGGGFLDYVGPHFARMAGGVIGLLSRQAAGRSLFDAASPVFAVPTWERVAAFLSVALVCIVLPIGMLAVWRRFHSYTVAVVFLVSGFVYPLTLLVRLSSGGGEIANRSWDFLYIALGFVLAAGIETFWLTRNQNAFRSLAVVALAGILLIGGLVVGSPGWARLPGPYMVGGDTRGIQPESLSTADWALRQLGPDNRMIADTSNKLLLGSYGGQYIVDGASWVYFSPELALDNELADLVWRGVEYVVMDHRLTEQLPRTNSYFEGGEPRQEGRSEPFDPALLEKFARTSCLSRLYDSGKIAIYRVSAACAMPIAGDGS